MTKLLPGFADPVRDSQATFRALLDAMAHPGKIQNVRPASAALDHGAGLAISPLHPATAALLLTLADAETPLWLDPAVIAVTGWVAFHCGAPLVSAAEAQFAVALADPPFAALHAGTDEEPENSATLILQVAALGAGDCYTLTGPGLASATTFAAAGLPPEFQAFWSANHRLFPRGIDLILTEGDRFAALPRTVRMERA